GCAGTGGTGPLDGRSLCVFIATYLHIQVIDRMCAPVLRFSQVSPRDDTSRARPDGEAMQDRRTVGATVRGAVTAVAVAALAAATFAAAPAAAAPTPAGLDRIATGGPSPVARLLARQTLPDGDGRGSAGAGT